MRLLLVSDEESAYLWDHFNPERLGQVDLILSAGDLKLNYLEFLLVMLHAPLVYVLGNHDAAFFEKPPGGCFCADGEVVKAAGLRIAGLGGCFGQNPTDCMQYTENAMAKQARKLERPIRKAGGIDILLTHAPAKGKGEGSDPFHSGFECFRSMVEVYQPRLHVFGHQHKRYGMTESERLFTGRTEHINACGYKILEL